MLERHFFVCYNAYGVINMEMLLEGILEGILELILDASLDAAGNKKVHWSIRLLASLILLAVFSALLGLGVLGTVYMANEGNILGAAALGIVSLFILVIFVVALIRKLREIKAKTESEISKPEAEYQGERWDLYDADGRLSDIKIKRGDTIPDGFYHLVCEILIKHADGSYLCMKRAATKPNYPNCYEATAGGAALCGEDKWQCVKRELREETGLSCNNINELSVYRDEPKKTVYHSFLGIVDCDKNSVKLQNGETDGYKWFSESEFAGFLKSGMAIDVQIKRFEKYYKEKGYI